MPNFTQGEWREHTDENGDVWVLAGDAEPGGMHAYFIGNMEDTCGECHANAELMVATPKMYKALGNILRYAMSCNEMAPAAGYRRIIKFAECGLKGIDEVVGEINLAEILALPFGDDND